MIKISITQEAYLKMKYFVDECPHEISGLGKARVVDFEVNNKIVKGVEIYDIEILKQVVSGAHSTISEEELAQFLIKKMKAKQNIKDYRVWWHSHCEMAAFFSGTDTTTIGGSTEFPWLVSIVTNKAGDFKTRFDRFGELPQTILDCDLEIQEEERNDIREWVIKEIAAKVSVAKVEVSEPTEKSSVLDKFPWKFNAPKKEVEEEFYNKYDDEEEMDDDEAELIQKSGGTRGW